MDMHFDEFKTIVTSMNYIEVGTFLHKRFPVVGKGAHRKVFQLSNNVVIKVDLQSHICKVNNYKFKFLKYSYPKAFNNSFTENYMEVEKYQKSKECNIFKFMPNCIGSVKLTDGTLLVGWELIKDYNESISKDLNYYFDKKNNQEIIIKSFDEFKKSLLSSKEKFHSLSPSNLLVQKINQKNFRIMLIDFGSWQDLSLIPIAALSQRAYQSKINRRFKKRFNFN